MAAIEIKDLTYAYEGGLDNILEHVSLHLDTGWHLGLVGRNGCGKTTFLKLLQGVLDSGGSISAPVELAYFPYPVPYPEESAGFAMEAVLGDTPQWRFLRELGQLDLTPDILDRPFSVLSGGEQVRVLLAALFAGEDRFLLIDEPTNHLDLEGRQIVGEYLRKKRGFILASHDRDLLDSCVDHILAINRADIVLRQGNFSAWQRDKAQRDALELRQNQRLKKDISRLETAAGRTKSWSDQVERSKQNTKNQGAPRMDKGYVGHKADKMMRRSKALDRRREEALEEKKGLLQNIEQADPLKLDPLPGRRGTLLELRDVSVRYGPTPVCTGVRFSLESGDRLALRGPNGCGKSSLLKLIMGENIPHTGDFYQQSGLKISYVPQDASFLRGGVQTYAEERCMDVSRFLTLLRKLGFQRVQFEGPMEGYSEGQKKKVLLAASLCQSADLYLWDEPLNFVDVLSRMQLEDMLRASDASMIFVEHDGAFCRAVATKTVDLR